MAHVSDFTQAGNKIVLDLINEQNNTALALNVVSVALSENAPTTKNTKAVVSSLQGSGYTGSVEVEYDRLNISDFVDLYYPQGLTLPQGDGETLADFIDEVNAGLGTNLIIDVDLIDVALEPWTTEPHETQVLTSEVMAGSMVYTGALSITIDGNDIPLSLIIVDTILDGLNLPVLETEE